MEILNVLILWLTLGLILISFNQTKKNTGHKKSKVKRHIFTIKTKKNLPTEDEKPQNTEPSTQQTETTPTESSPVATNSNQTIPKPKQAGVFVADFEAEQNDNVEIKESSDTNSTESIVEPIEEEVEQIENTDGGSGFEEEIITAAEVEDDESFFAGIEMENVFDAFFSEKNPSEPPTYTIEESEEEEEISGEYNTFSYSEEPWFEHESVRKLIKDTNIFEKEPRKFEVIEKGY